MHSKILRRPSGCAKNSIATAGSLTGRSSFSDQESRQIRGGTVDTFKSILRNEGITVSSS